MMYKKTVAKAKEQAEKALKIKKVVEEFYRNPNNEFGTQLLDRLKTIIRHLSHDDTIEIVWGTLLGGSYMDDQNNKIVFDPSLLPSDVPELTEGLLLMYFVSAHEVVHKLITRYPQFIEEFIQETGMHGYFEELGLGTICNAVEDPRDNDYMKIHNPGSKRWQSVVYDPQFKAENTILFGQPLLLEKLKQTLGYVPLFIIYTSEIIRFWHTSKFSAKLPSQVQELLDKTKDSFVKAYREMPANLAEFEVLRAARKSFDIIIQEIWNKGYKDLLDELKQLEESRQMLKEPQSLKDIWDKLTPQEQHDILDQIQKTLQELAQQQQQQAEQHNGVPPAGGKAQPGDQSQSAADNSAQGTESAGKEIAPLGKEKDSGNGNLEKVPENWGGEIDMNGLNNETKKKLAKLKEGLSEEKQGELAKQAIESIKEATEELAKSAQTIFDHPETENQNTSAQSNNQTAIPQQKTEIKPLTAEEQRTNEQKSQELIKQMNQTSQASSLQIGLDQFSRYLVDYKGPIDLLTSELGLILAQNARPEERRKRNSGPIVVMEDAMQMEADPGLYNVFAQRRSPQEREYAFLTIVDISRSMLEYEKIKAASIGSAISTAALNNLSIPNALGVFNEDFRMIKNFEHDLNSEVRKRLGLLEQMPAGNTLDGDALWKGYQYILKQPAQYKFIVIITDGGSGQAERLKSVLAKIAKEQQVMPVIALGFGEETANLGEHYPISLPKLNHKNFPKLYPKLLKDIMENPQNYTWEQVMTRKQGVRP